ncbi:maleylpyruvate isomerase family mycothiol-dependent enzyme [Isoptericola sp. NEAU-Y5]|uniref:Maleylpyruvate isomerase family mycothiol-dependent enzyme n=1 Tax=Isoptericola luteus TaxID=2879484 RepID=A0ABS7ZFB2_9MICO|nr:maleylpyruvate isomerase family mycothiol-dependent enzyme [Isoptericola sp. NEAU-Y5]MCA5893716.1 maleylpyruvate isomerase family mycothiol-dependent enzyme [Isoptericola sp. NEAU-Y5]
MTAAAHEGSPEDDVATRGDLWSMIHAERAALAEELAGLDDEAWRTPSLCTGWSVQDVVAHLTAGASTGRWAWLRSIVAAGFDADKHNARRLAEHRGPDPADTLRRFRAVVDSRVAPSGDTAAWLGEVVVHAQDVRRPLGITTVPPVATLTPVARFFAAKDFAVNSRSTARGLRLVATDGPFAAGSGPEVHGTTLALVMVMAGRASFCDELSGGGVAIVRDRLAPPGTSPRRLLRGIRAEGGQRGDVT